MIINILLTVLAMALFFMLYRMRRKTAVVLVPIFVQYIWMFLSLSVIENGGYIGEQSKFGYFTSSTISLFTFFISTGLAVVLTHIAIDSLSVKTPAFKFKFGGFREKDLIFVMLVALLSMAYINLFLSPIPLFSDEVNRFNFWEYAKFPFLKVITGNVMTFFVFALFIAGYNRKTTVITFLLYLLYIVLLGQKFSGFLAVSVTLVIAFVLKDRVRGINFRAAFQKKIILPVALVFSLMYFYYAKNNPWEHLGYSPLESIVYRAFSLQAHAYWGMHTKYVYEGVANSWEFGELVDGMHNILYDLTPKSDEFVEDSIRRGVTWTNGYPSILLRVFPFWLAIGVNALLFAIYGLVSKLLVDSVSKNQILVSVVFFQLLMWVLYDLTMGYLRKIPLVLCILGLYFSVVLLYQYLTKANAR